MRVRPAVGADLDRVAALHAERIGEGFLPTLGHPFLRRLYRRVLRSHDAFLLVADDERGLDPAVGPTFGPALGFVAGAADLRALYRRFVLRDGLIAGARSAGRIARSLPRVMETLRYPAGGSSEPALPHAEILAVAVDAAASGRGVGRTLMLRANQRFVALGVPAAKVVTAAGNDPALALYRSTGYEPRARIAVHAGAESEVLVWNSSSG